MIILFLLHTLTHKHTTNQIDLQTNPNIQAYKHTQTYKQTQKHTNIQAYKHTQLINKQSHTLQRSAKHVIK